MTAVDAECPHGLGDPSWCSVCKHGAAQHPRRERRSTQPPFRAKFEGTCPECRHVIQAGALVRRCTSDEYVHAGCVEGPAV